MRKENYRVTIGKLGYIKYHAALLLHLLLQVSPPLPLTLQFSSFSSPEAPIKPSSKSLPI